MCFLLTWQELGQETVFVSLSCWQFEALLQSVIRGSPILLQINIYKGLLKVLCPRVITTLEEYKYRKAAKNPPLAKYKLCHAFSLLYLWHKNVSVFYPKRMGTLL